MPDGWQDDQLSLDSFLGGKLRIYQPKQGYRAGIDPVLLAASVVARAGESVLELGCGVGTALLCLGRRVPGLDLAGVELQGRYADLARRNSELNCLRAEIFTADMTQLPSEITQRQYTHVIANPPYFDRAAGTRAHDQGRETALGENVPLAGWISIAAKRVAPKGYVSVIHRVEKLPELLAACEPHLGSLEVLPLIPRPGREARLVLLRGRKGGRAGFRLHHGWILHDGPEHPGDQENYTNATTYVLRGGEALLY